MHVVSGSVSLAAQHERLQTRHLEEHVETWTTPAVPRDAVSVSPGAQREEQPLGTREALNRLIFEKMFGVKIAVSPPTEPPAETGTVVQPGPAAVPRSGPGASSDRVELRTDTERLAVQGHVQVTTSDGRVIDASLALSQAREVVQRDEVHLQVGAPKQAVDPLALDLDGGGVSLTSGSQAFDLTGDGTPETISRLSSGDAWLALDRNGNGRVDDGRELFGPATGNGFGELGALDSDADGFLDEDDASFGQLRLWRPGTDGGDGPLTTLAQEGVGAVGLGSVSTPFQLTGGATRATGLYLREDGRAGVIQHVDLEV